VEMGRGQGKTGTRCLGESGRGREKGVSPLVEKGTTIPSAEGREKIETRYNRRGGGLKKQRERHDKIFGAALLLGGWLGKSSSLGEKKKDEHVSSKGRKRGSSVLENELTLKSNQPL